MSALVGAYQKDFQQYPAWLVSLGLDNGQSVGIGFDWGARRPVFQPWGGTTPCTVYMLDVGGALGLPTVSTPQPGGWNLQAFTTWTAFAAVRPTAGRGDWVLFPGGTTVVPDVGHASFWPALNSLAGKNRQYPTVIGTYDASSLANAKDSTRFNKTICKIDWSAITFPGQFLTASSSPSTTALNYLHFDSLWLYAPNVQNQINGIFISQAGTYVTMHNVIQEGVPCNIQYNQITTQGALFLNTLTSLTSTGTAVTLVDSTGHLPTLVQQGLTTVAITGATQTAYNGTFVLTYVNATTVSYTALTAPSASPATGSPVWTAPFATVPDNLLLTNVARFGCSGGYCAGFGSTPTGGAGKVQDLYVNNVRRFRAYREVHMHGGWKRPSLRSPLPKVPTSITSSGTTATINLTGIGTLVTGGQTHWVVQNASPAAFNGMYTLTASGADAATYTFAGASNASASPVGSCYAQNGSAAVNAWTTIASTAITSLSQTGGVATALTANTGTLANGSWVSIGGATPSTGGGSYSFVTQVFNVVANTSFQYNVDATIASTATGASMVWADATAGGWVPTQGDPANIFNHSVYFNDTNDDLGVFDWVVGWECVNMKFTGGSTVISRLVEVRNPEGPIFSSNSNDTSNMTWPNNSGANLVFVNHTMISTDDMTYVTNGFRGTGPILNQKATVQYSKSLLMNQDNPNPSNRNGMLVTNGVLTLPSGVTTAGLISDFVATGTSGTNVTASFNGCITADASGVISAMNALGAGNEAMSSTPAAFQANLALARARNIHTTFREETPELAGVTVGATTLLTEQNVLDFIMRNPTLTNWAVKMEAHKRQPIGV